MAWIREAPSRGWRAEYRGSDGRKHSRTLRHTAAAIAIDTGAQPIHVQRMLGLASIQMTLGTYGHLFAKREEVLAAKLDVRARKAAASLPPPPPPGAPGRWSP
jgi:integrase